MDQDGRWPTHAYVPGKNARHAEGTFDRLRETARDDLTVAELSTCKAFEVGLAYLNAGYFWEAHELFEPVWMALPNPSRERKFVQGLIQIANGLLKLKMDRPKAASRLEGIARALIEDDGISATMGVKQQDALDLLDTLRVGAEDAL